MLQVSRQLLPTSVTQNSFLPLIITGGKQSFTADDEKLFTDYLAFAGIGLMNAQLFEMSILENKRSKILLNMARWEEMYTHYKPEDVSELLFFFLQEGIFGKNDEPPY